MAFALEEARTSQVAPAVSGLVTIKGKLVDLLPLTVIVIGIILTFIWDRRCFLGLSFAH